MEHETHKNTHKNKKQGQPSVFCFSWETCVDDSSTHKKLKVGESMGKSIPSHSYFYHVQDLRVRCFSCCL